MALALVWVVTVMLLALGVEGTATNVSSLCSPFTTAPKVTKGSNTYVCINVNDEYRTVFMPVADKFTVLRVTDSWNDTRIGANPDGAFLTVSSLNYRTYYKLYASSTGRLYPFLTAIISVKKGVVQGVSWDDGCYFCDSTTCESNLWSYASNSTTSQLEDGNTCYTDSSSCSGDNSSVCDITLYVGWTGTDRNGEYLSSAGLRMSQFKKYSIGSYFSSITSSLSNLLPSSRFDT